jgi:hypothetical protein
MKNAGNQNGGSKNNRIRFVTVLSAIVTAVTIAMIAIILASTPRDECEKPWEQVALMYLCRNEGWFNFTVTDICLYHDNDPNLLSLSNVYLTIAEGGSTVLILDNGSMESQVFLSKAKVNPFYTGSVVFFDTDGDDKVSTGDHLRIMSTDFGGPVEEGVFVELFRANPVGSLTVYKCCE